MALSFRNQKPNPKTVSITVEVNFDVKMSWRDAFKLRLAGASRVRKEVDRIFDEAREKVED